MSKRKRKEEIREEMENIKSFAIMAFGGLRLIIIVVLIIYFVVDYISTISYRFEDFTKPIMIFLILSYIYDHWIKKK